MSNKEQQRPRRNFETVCRDSGLSARALLSTARTADMAVREVAEIAQIAGRMGYNPNRVVQAIRR